MADVGFVMKDGYDDDLQAWLTGTNPSAYTLRLFSNAHSPLSTDAVAAYTELTSAGYAAIALVTGNWAYANLGGAVQQALYPSQLFSGTGGTTINGYYVTRASDGHLILAFRPSAAPLVFAGDWAVFASIDIRSPG